METENNRYQNPALEAYLKSSFAEINGNAKIDAERLASKNLPRPSADRMPSYVEESHLSHQALMDKVNAEVQFKTTCGEVAEKQKSCDQKTHELRNKLAAAKEKKVQVDSKCKNVSYPVYLLRLILAELAIILISLFEGILSIPVYEIWGFNLVESILMGGLFATVLAIFAQTFLDIVNLGKTVWQRRLIAFGLLSLLTGMFTYMAIARADYLSSLANANAVDSLNIHFSPLPFIFTSILLFIVAVAVHHFYMPTQEQKDAIREYKRLQKEKKAIDGEIEKIDADIKTEEKENSDLRTTNASMLVYGSMLEEMIKNNAKSCYALWKKHNLMHRPDHSKPDCFNEPYPFTFNTNFHSVNDNNHEKNN
jgi:cell division protein FtsB